MRSLTRMCRDRRRDESWTLEKTEGLGGGRQRVRESGEEGDPEGIMSQKRISQSMWAWAPLQQRGQRTHFKPISCVASLHKWLWAFSQDRVRHGLRALHAVCGRRPVLTGNNIGLYLMCLVQNWVLVGSQQMLNQWMVWKHRLKFWLCHLLVWSRDSYF